MNIKAYASNSHSTLLVNDCLIINRLLEYIMIKHCLSRCSFIQEYDSCEHSQLINHTKYGRIGFGVVKGFDTVKAL